MGEIDSLRALLAERMPPSGPEPVEPLRKILCVGGQGTPRGLQGNDRSFFLTSIGYLAESGMPVDPDFQIEICNRDPRYGGQDFLTCESKADLIFFLFLFSPTPEDVPYYSQLDPLHEMAVSPLHSPQAFRESILRTGARVVMCRSSGGELDEEALLSKKDADREKFPYDLLVSTSEHIQAVCGWDKGALSKTFKARLSPPGTILVRHDFAAALSSGLSPQMQDRDYDTLLHKRMAEWAPG